MGVGNGLTVTIVDVVHPKPEVNVRVSVPAESPVNTPPEAMLPTELPDNDHVPPPEASENVAVVPKHTLVLPVMDAGNPFTVTLAVVTQDEGEV